MNFEITLEIVGTAFCSGDAQVLSGVSTIRFTAAQNNTNSKQFEEFPEGLGERQAHKLSALNCSEFSWAVLVIFCMEAVSMQETSAQWILMQFREEQHWVMWAERL